MNTTLPLWVIICATLITALGGFSAIRTLFLVPSERRKVTADVHQAEAAAVKMFGEAANLLVAPLTERVKDLEGRERAAQLEIARLNAEVARLSGAENAELGWLRSEVQRLTRDLAQAEARRTRNQPPAGEAP